MSNNLQLYYDGNTIELRRPGFGYSTNINMGLHFGDVPIFGDVAVWDDGAVYDHRSCQIRQWLINKTEHFALTEFLNDVGKGRGENHITLKLGATSSGFFPFGADYGDKGDFIIEVPTNDFKEGHNLYDPFRWWENEIVFRLVPGSPLPSYTPPAAESEGVLAIGSVAHLLCPQQAPMPNHTRVISSSKTNNGSTDFVDVGSSIDEWESTIPLEMRTGNTAAIISFLTGSSGRGNLFSISVPDYLYPFGYIGSASEMTTMDAQLFMDKLQIVHANNERFTMDLKLKFLGVPS